MDDLQRRTISPQRHKGHKEELQRAKNIHHGGHGGRGESTEKENSPQRPQRTQRKTGQEKEHSPQGAQKTTREILHATTRDSPGENGERTEIKAWPKIHKGDEESANSARPDEKKTNRDYI
jgi:hypothetical protein